MAGAADEVDHDVYAKDAGGINCFSTAAPSEPCEGAEVAELQIATGDTVTWTFVGDAVHNAASSNEVAADPSWTPWERPVDDYASEGSFTRQFTQPGEYRFICELHPGMSGTITVTGDPVEPTATATATATTTATPTTQPGGGNGGGGADDDHTQTPAPDGGPADAIAPTIEGVKVKALRRGARVRFSLSEPASVKIRVKRRGRRGNALRTVHVQAPTGTSKVRIRGKRLRRGRYVVQLRARDAMGNRSTLARDNFRGRRR